MVTMQLGSLIALRRGRRVAGAGRTFTLYGGAISFIATSPPATPVVADPATPVNGPFSADFKWATLPDVQATPIQFTDGQSKVFGALWSFKGEATTAERTMQRAGLDSANHSHQHARRWLMNNAVCVCHGEEVGAGFERR
jgi:hypothetical protein